MIFKIFEIIGNAMTSIMILPPNKILSPILAFPVSEQIFAENSTKYPIPIIFNKSVYKSEFKPVKDTIFFKEPKIEDR